jgi:hypothetical protein
MRRMTRVSATVLVVLGLLFSLAGLAPSASAQQAPAAWSVVVPQPATIGVDDATATAFAELLRSELARAGLAVVPRAQTAPTPCGDASCGLAAAQQAHTRGAVPVTLSRLGDTVIVQFAHVASDGRVLLSDRASAARLADLDPISSRVATAVATGRPMAETMGTSTVTAREAQPQTRRRALVTAGARLGPLVPIADSYGKSGTLGDLGFLALLELREIALSAEIDFLWTLDRPEGKPTAFSFQFNLGGRYFLDPEADSAVYLSGGLGFRSLSFDTHAATSAANVTGSATGLGLFGGVGVMFLRTSDVHILLDARYDVDAFGVNGFSPGGGHGIVATVGLTYSGFAHIF